MFKSLIKMSKKKQCIFCNIFYKMDDFEICPNCGYGTTDDTSNRIDIIVRRNQLNQFIGKHDQVSEKIK